MLQKLLNYRDILVKYKSFIILAIVVSIVSFILGRTTIFNRDLSWVYYNREKTQEFILHSKDVFNLQREIYLNFTEAYNLIAECLKFDKQTCDPEIAGKQLDDLQKKRDQMVTKLNELNYKTETLLQKMGFVR